MLSSTSQKTATIWQPPLTASSPLPPHVKHLGASRPVHVHHEATPQAPVSAPEPSACSTAAAGPAWLRQSCSICSNLAARQTTVASESSTVATPEAPAASAAHDRQPPRERGPSGSAAFSSSDIQRLLLLLLVSKKGIVDKTMSTVPAPAAAMRFGRGSEQTRGAHRPSTPQPQLSVRDRQRAHAATTARRIRLHT